VAIKRRSGFSGVPVTATGQIGGKLLGILFTFTIKSGKKFKPANYLKFQKKLKKIIFLGLVTSRDVDFIRADEHAKTLIAQVMVPRERLMVGGEKLTLQEAYDILQKEKKGIRKII
jgi:IMP dehydrogenase